MSNSSLVDYVRISPNSTNPRSNSISKITIHHMAGNLTVEQCGQGFSNKKRQASSNYGISSDGRVGLYVDEANRSWASSNRANDNMAVTIEVANDSGGPDWHISDVALAKLIDLCVDICQRNGIKQFNFTGDKTGNLTMHKYFAATACPGPYLESKFPYITEEVNRRLSGKPELKTVNDIVWELNYRGIITNPKMWLLKLKYDKDAYWLAYKAANRTINFQRSSELESVNDIVWELNYRNIMTDSRLWLSVLSYDTNLYWLARKIANMTRNN